MFNRITHIILGTILLLLAGCQVIPENERLLPLPMQEPQSNALLIDFTGFLCVNCPTAAAEAQRLQTDYPDNLVVVAMHPADNHFTQTTIAGYDYTCPEANIYYSFFGGTSTTPFPTGVIDMQPGWRSYTEWATAVRASVMQPKGGLLFLQITNVNEAERSFTVSTSAIWENNNVNPLTNETDVEILLWLVADSVQGAQMMPDGSTNLAYTHRHMLRACLTDDPWGMFNGIVTNTTEPCAAGLVHYQVQDTVGGQVLPLAHYSVVGILLDPASKKLIDVQQTKIITKTE